MKDSLLLIMTPNMSLAQWDKTGLLSRELDIYQKICAATGLRLIVYSYGRDEKSFLAGIPGASVLEIPGWIPKGIPFSVQNLLYHMVSPVLFFRSFKRIKIAKTNQYAASVFGLLIKVLFNIQLVIRMGYYHTHLKPKGRLWCFMEKIAFSYCDRILVTSKSAEHFIKEEYHIDPNKITTIHNSIDIELFKPANTPKQVDVLFVGRLEKVKNIGLLTDFLKKTICSVLVIGDGSLSGEIDAITQINDNIKWIKRVDNRALPNYYNLARVYILISEYEGNPKSLLEAMSCGLPCIGTNVPGIAECISQDYTGLLIGQHVNVLASAVNHLLSNPLKAQKIGENAREWIIASCDMQQNIVEEAEFYKLLLADSPHQENKMLIQN